MLIVFLLKTIASDSINPKDRKDYHPSNEVPPLEVSRNCYLQAFFKYL